MNRCVAFLMVLLLLQTIPLLSPAEELQGNGSVSLLLENDFFNEQDRHYTGGARLTWVPEQDTLKPRWAVALARLAPWFPQHGGVNHGYSLGQTIFTPQDISTPDPSPEDRPYAGWLYLSVGLQAVSDHQLDYFALSVGMVGPASLAEQSQKFVHNIVGSSEPQGWDTQLHNEPGIIITYERSWRGFFTPVFSDHSLSLSPHVGGAVGNVYIYANAGATVRFGKKNSYDYGPPRIMPGLPGSADFSSPSGFGWYLFAGIDGRLVLRNIFLDGNTFRDSPRVDKYPLVGDLQIGLVVNLKYVGLSFTHVTRTREFKTQHGFDEYGALSLSINY